MMGLVLVTGFAVVSTRDGRVRERHTEMQSRHAAASKFSSMSSSSLSRARGERKHAAAPPRIIVASPSSSSSLSAIAAIASSESSSSEPVALAMEIEPEPASAPEPVNLLTYRTPLNPDTGVPTAEEEERTEIDPHTKVGVYLTPQSVADDELLDDTITRLLEAGGDTLVFDVKGSAVFFASEAPLAKKLGLVNPVYDLPAIVQKAHEKGIYVVARFVAIKDGSLAKAVPAAQIRHPATGVSVGDRWVDPWHPTVIEYNMQVLQDIVFAGVDEVNFDYIRYPTEYYPDFKTIGLTGMQKADHLEAFLKSARAIVDAADTGTKLGISTYAILGWDFQTNVESVGQDITRFAPLVDVISPMAYPATFAINAYYNPERDPGSRMYYLVYRTLEGYKELVGEEGVHKLRPWIQGYGITEKNLRDEIQGVMDAGMCGFTVWNADNAYKPVYDVLKKWERPEGCGEGEAIAQK